MLHSELTERRARLLQMLKPARADAFLTTARPNVHYLSGFTGSNGALLLSADRGLLFTDPRYATQAPQQSDCEVVVAKGPVLAETGKWIKRLKYRTIAF